MRRLSREQALQHALPEIKKTILKYGTKIFRLDEISQILSENKPNWLLPKVTRLEDFTNFIAEKKLLSVVSIDNRSRTSIRLASNEITPSEIVLSLREKSYISHYTALFFHGLTNNVPKTIYTNLEQTPKPSSGKSSLTQSTIDLAFSNAMRTTNNIAEFEFQDEKYKAFLLNGQFQNYIGVTQLLYNDRNLPITTLERTLIDVTVRPIYGGGVHEVLTAYEVAKDKISVNTLLATLKEMKFTYPYHQAIGFYLELSGYKENLLRLVEKTPFEFDFYLTYKLKNPKYSTRWKIYYPSELDQVNVL